MPAFGQTYPEVPVHLTVPSVRAIRISALDGLRGLAAVGVVVFHGYPGIGFWMGSFVDLFFVISGFVITRMLISAPAGHQVSLKHFWMRRILRIWPVYFAVVGTGTMLVLMVAAGGTLRLPDSWWKCLLFLQFTESYGPHSGRFVELFLPYVRWLGHSWSLAVEEQFYLFWPLLLVIFSGTWRLLGLCLAVVAACCVANLSGWPPLTLATRGIGLAMGAMLAVAELKLRAVPYGHAWRHAAASFSGLVLCVALLYEAPRVAAIYAGSVSWVAMGPPAVQARDMLAFATLYAGLIGWVLFYDRGLLASALSARVLVYLGGTSYALYMFHFPLMALFGRTGMRWPLLQHLPLLEQLGYWLVLIAMAHLSRQWFERPFNERKHAYPLYVPRTG
jgi:peptidoglycan/LPS O-acetylase OafA/YrhL